MRLSILVTSFIVSLLFVMAIGKSSFAGAGPVCNGDCETKIFKNAKPCDEWATVDEVVGYSCTTNDGPECKCYARESLVGGCFMRTFAPGGGCAVQAKCYCDPNDNPNEFLCVNIAANSATARIAEYAQVVANGKMIVKGVEANRNDIDIVPFECQLDSTCQEQCESCSYCD